MVAQVHAHALARPGAAWARVRTHRHIHVNIDIHIHMKIRIRIRMRIRICTYMQAAICSFFDLSPASLDTELFPNKPGSAFPNTPPSHPDESLYNKFHYKVDYQGRRAPCGLLPPYKKLNFACFGSSSPRPFHLHAKI